MEKIKTGDQLEQEAQRIAKIECPSPQYTRLEQKIFIVGFMKGFNLGLFQLDKETEAVNES